MVEHKLTNKLGESGKNKPSNTASKQVNQATGEDLIRESGVVG